MKPDTESTVKKRLRHHFTIRPSQNIYIWFIIMLLKVVSLYKSLINNHKQVITVFIH